MMRLLRETRCVAALEFALLAPVFIVVFAGTVDLGNALYTWSKVEAALAVGANYAVTHTGQVNATDGAALASAIAAVVSASNPGTAANATVVVNAGPTVIVSAGTPASSGTAASANSCYCPSGAPANWTWGTAVACGSTCAGSTSVAGKFVTITAGYDFTPFFASYGFVQNGAITGGAAVQTQ